MPAPYHTSEQAYSALLNATTQCMAALSGAERPYVAQQVWAAAAEWLTRTLSWQPPQTFTVTSGVDSYIMPVRSVIPFTQAVALFHAKIGDYDLKPTRGVTYDSVRVASGSPSYCQLVDNYRLVLSPPPDRSGQQVWFLAALTLPPLSRRLLQDLASSQTGVAYLATEIDQSILTEDARAIVLDYGFVFPLPDCLQVAADALFHGAMARLLLVDGRPWTNPVLSRVHAARFTTMIQMQRASVAAGGTYGAGFVRMRRFGA